MEEVEAIWRVSFKSVVEDSSGDDVFEDTVEAFQSGLTKDTPGPNFLYRLFRPWLGSEKKNLLWEKREGKKQNQAGATMIGSWGSNVRKLTFVDNRGNQLGAVSWS
jgi:hypothetical protein